MSKKSRITNTFTQTLGLTWIVSVCVFVCLYECLRGEKFLVANRVPCGIRAAYPSRPNNATDGSDLKHFFPSFF